MLTTSSDRITVQASINGTSVFGLLRASVSNSNCFSADTFSATFALGADNACGIDYWATVNPALIEITAINQGPSGASYLSLIIGNADSLHLDPISGTVALEGRDLSSTLIDSFRQQDFVNQTASEIVSVIAQGHGLNSAVTPTQENVGRYYADGYTKLTLGQFTRMQSDWDLVVQLARQNAFDAFVKGTTLYFQNSSASNGPQIEVSYSDTKSIRIQRTLSVESDSVAQVQSWNTQNMAAYVGNGSQGDEVSSSDLTLPNSRFLFSASNYTPKQVTDSAAQYSLELARLSTVLILEMPWDLTLFPRTTIFLNGTNSIFDTTYRIESVDRHYSSTSGCLQIVRAVRV